MCCFDSLKKLIYKSIKKKKKNIDSKKNLSNYNYYYEL